MHCEENYCASMCVRVGPTPSTKNHMHNMCVCTMNYMYAWNCSFEQVSYGPLPQTMGGLSALSVVVPSEEWQGYEISLLLTAETGELVGGPGTDQLERERERQTERKIRRKGQRALILNATSTQDQPITCFKNRREYHTHNYNQSKPQLFSPLNPQYLLQPRPLLLLLH